MVGSLYAITRGPSTLDVPQPPMSLSTFRILFFLMGGLILAGLELLKARLEQA
jgi:putative membrane protein